MNQDNDKPKRKQKNFQVFLKNDEWQRYEEILERATLRHDSTVNLPKAHIIRRLVGLDAPDKLVTKADIEYFLHNTPIESQIIPELPSVSSKVESSDVQKNKKIPIKKVSNRD